MRLRSVWRLTIRCDCITLYLLDTFGVRPVSEVISKTGIQVIVDFWIDGAVVDGIVRRSIFSFSN